MHVPDDGRAAVMTQAKAPLRLIRYPLPELEPGAVLVKVTCCTVCGSDLHTWLGRRPAQTPMILGHEIVGRIVALGKAGTLDSDNQPLREGDRITWTLCASCGRCSFCRERGLPMKCRQLRKYGHERCDAPPHFVGGFAEYCYLFPGTGIVKIPEELPDEVVAPANCALATVVAGWEAVGLQTQESVLIQGAGALGVYAAALARHYGCRRILVTDVLEHRLVQVREFGATDTFNSAEGTEAEIVQWVLERTDGCGVDAAMEVTGIPAVIPVGLKCLRIGGRYVLHGNVVPGAEFSYDAADIVFRWLTIRGVHNYDTRHLRKAVQFLQSTQDAFPFGKIVAHRVGLEELGEGLHIAQSGQALRVAVVP